jgi:hypothetical protein
LSSLFVHKPLGRGDHLLKLFQDGQSSALAQIAEQVLQSADRVFDLGVDVPLGRFLLRVLSAVAIVHVEAFGVSHRVIHSAVVVQVLGHRVDHFGCRCHLSGLRVRVAYAYLYTLNILQI